MKKTFTHNKKNWIQYGFETIVVTVGILGAFSLENWYENRRMKDTENKLLNEMVTGLTNDIQIINTNIALHESGAQACTIILESFIQDQPYNDSLSQYFAMIHNYTVFAPNKGAYESIKSLGIEIIQEDEIRLESIRLYEQHYVTFQENIRNFREQVLDLKMNLNPRLFEEFNLFDLDKLSMSKGDYGGRMVPTDFENLKTNHVYQYHIKSLRSGHTILIEYNKMTKRQIESLIELITQKTELGEN
jgi:hypothetical protein